MPDAASPAPPRPDPDRPAAWRVHKFGGTSLADAACFRRVAALLQESATPRFLVVASACAGVTDRLLAAAAAARNGSEAAWRAHLDELDALHTKLARAVMPPEACRDYLDDLHSEVEELAGVLRTVGLLADLPNGLRDRISGYGELWSSRLLAAVLRRTLPEHRVLWADARDLLVADPGELGPVVAWSETRARTARLAAGEAPVAAVAPGFVARDSGGRPITLGRNGSDLSAALFGVVLEADEVVIWTDVDGVLSADPRRVPEARVVATLSYDEAMELAYFGARVLHPRAIQPTVAAGVPVRIANSFAPGAAGTRIGVRGGAGHTVKGITTVEEMALVNLEGSGMIGVPGTAHRLFGALRDAGISVALISQGSSEHSICFAVAAQEAETAVQVVRRAFDMELREGQIHAVEISRDVAILAVVGDGMAGTHGVSARVFGALGRAAVNVRAIAQGASERNISLVIEGADASKALRAVHAEFHLSPHTLSVGLIGPGSVGSVLLEQIRGAADALRREARVELQVRAIADSRRMILSDRPIDPGGWRDALEERGEPLDLARFVEHVAAPHLPHRVVVDCTADGAIPEHYPAWLRRGVHVVTPNKKGNSAAMTEYRAIRRAARESGARFFYETNVGAGLPVILTLRDLLATGDTVHVVEGIFSGTLAYLFNAYDGSVPFSRIVRDAREKGFTEPDPREDLSGLDVARKLIILGREMGLDLELDQVEVESLVPPGMEEGGVDAFLDALPAMDAEMEQLHEESRNAGRVLRYVGRLTAQGEVRVGIARLERDHPFANVALTDNVVRFVTDRYRDNPLVVQGPGAGADVTAAGVFGDLLRLASHLGAPL
jgi:aspartokinase/homoserine dehydrogenase 1